MAVDLQRVVTEVLRGYALPWTGIHGLGHWGRVMENGLRLAAFTGASVDVVTLFAMLHDARRTNESLDPGHGRRGAELARTLRGTHFELDDDEVDLLCLACADHTRGLTGAHVTVATCWDADRLDLARVGIRPSSHRLCTAAARAPATIAWANDRASNDVTPDSVQQLWAQLERERRRGR